MNRNIKPQTSNFKNQISKRMAILGRSDFGFVFGV